MGLIIVIIILLILTIHPVSILKAISCWQKNPYPRWQIGTSIKQRLSFHV